MIDEEEQEILLNTLAETPQEEVHTIEEDIYVIGVESLNGQAGDLTLKSINGENLVGEGDIALQTPLTTTQLTAVNSGIDATKVGQIANNATNITTLQNTKQDNLTQTQLNAVNSGVDETKVAQIATNTGNITSVTNRVTTIEGKIPSAASSTNKLTDKNYVDNAIATNTANYISDNGQPFQSYAELVAYSGPLTNNDYAFVETIDQAGNDIYTRYKYNAGQNLWAEEYTITNPYFTSDQWASINSGIAANDVAQIGTNKTDIAGLQSSKQDKLTTAQQSAVDSGIDATKVQQIADNTTAISTKQDKLIAGTNIQIAADGKTISATDTTYTAGTGLTLTSTQFSVTDPVPSGFFTGSATTTGTGTSISLDGTTEASLQDVTLKGDTTQATYTGKNIFNKDATPLSVSTDTSVSVLSTGIRVSLSAATTNAKSAIYILRDISAQVGKKVVVSATMVASGNNTTRVAIGVCKSDGSDRVTKTTLSQTGYITYTIASADVTDRPYCYIYVYGNVSGGSAQSGDYADYTDLQVEINDTGTPTTYEQYVGGTPSPNPSYPQTIHTVTGDQTVKVTGKNIWNPTAYQENHFIAANGTESTNTTTNTWGNIYVPAGTNMAISATPGDTSSTAIRVHAFTLAGVWKEQVAVLTLTGGNYGSATFTTPNEPVLLRWCGSKKLSSCQLEVGSTATAYKSYQSQIYPISLGSIELAKIGDYQDYIWKDGSTWKLHKATGKTTLNGTSEGTWSMFSNGNAAYVNYPNLPQETSASSIVTAMVMSDYYRGVLCSAINTTTPTEEYGIAYYGSNSARSRFVLRNKDCADADAIKTWLAAHNTTVYYILATPTDTAITDAALIGQLEALASVQTYNPQTNIASSATGTNLPVILTVDAFKNNWAGTIASINSELGGVETALNEVNNGGNA